MRKKISIEDGDYNELRELMNVGIKLRNTGETIISKVENTLSTLATYGVEVPEKRIKNVMRENSRSVTWVGFD
tara:strand:- start:863 stop:1081 length:219 start_codon:yes stop_codon:yes gene_type:complete